MSGFLTEDNASTVRAPRIREIVNSLATVMLVLCALVVTGSIASREFRDSRLSKGRTFEKVKDWQRYHISRGWIGDSSAPVQITVFSDFQCPFCATLSSTLDSVVAKFPGRVSWNFRHYPLTILHADALTAAIASECARDQHRFEKFHDVLFASQPSIGVVGWQELSARADIRDSIAFGTCLSSRRHEALVRSDSVAAADLGVGGTPTILVNEWMYAGAPTIELLINRIESELREKNE